MIKSLHGLNVKLTNLNSRRNPILDGIESADGIHVVSQGSLKELKDDIMGKHYFYPESSVVDLDKVFVATNGIDHEKFSLPKNWIMAKKKFPAELKSFPDTIEQLNLYEQKQLFKKALAEILPNLVKQDRLLSSSWCNYFDPNKTMMLFVGRLCKEKAYERLEIAAEVAKEKGAHLVIMGFGDPIFEAKTKEKYPEVIFLNNLQDQGLIGTFLRGGADICLLTSNQETAGLVLLEGQTMGQTVLTSSLPGPVGLSNPKTFHQFNIVVKDGIMDKDNGFNFVDEKATRGSFYIHLNELIDYFAQSSKEDILKDMESNVQFSKQFTPDHMLAELDALYLASEDRRASQ